MNKNRCPNCLKVCNIRNAFCPHCGYKLEENDVLYHYTSIETLNAILSNINHKAPYGANNDSLDFYKFVLRATHWGFFNDPLESQFFYQKLLNFFENNPKLRKYKEKFINTIGVTSYFSGVPYIISLSKCADNLDMWRSYSRNGVGVAIGLSAKKIVDISADLNLKQKFNEAKLYNCHYLDDKQIYYVIKKEYQGHLRNILAMEKIPGNGFDPLVKAFTSYKHPCYINERETRIVIFYHNLRQSDTKFRVSNGINIPYLEVEFPLSAINEIVIGPCANKEQNDESIRMQLDYTTRFAKDIQIKFSELPYRHI